MQVSRPNYNIIPNANIENICIETLVELHQELKGVKSSSKFLVEGKTAKCETKRKLYQEIFEKLHKQIDALRAEYKLFKSKPHTYEERMKFLIGLIDKYKVANCGEINDLYQYKLAQKGIYSEAKYLQTYKSYPHSETTTKIDHLYLDIKENANQPSLFAADGWLNEIKPHTEYEDDLNKYMQLSATILPRPGNLKQINGYDEFILQIRESKSTH